MTTVSLAGTSEARRGFFPGFFFESAMFDMPSMIVLAKYLLLLARFVPQHESGPSPLCKCHT